MQKDVGQGVGSGMKVGSGRGWVPSPESGRPPLHPSAPSVDPSSKFLGYEALVQSLLRSGSGSIVLRSVSVRK
jgi:hypothetical protein